MKQPRPYPIEPLAHELGIDPANTTQLARRLGIARRWVSHYRTLGLTEHQADLWACRAGLVPQLVWDNWENPTDDLLEGLYGAALDNALKTSCPRGHPYDTLDSLGFRRCRRCWYAAIYRHKKSQVKTLLTEEAA